VAVETIEELRQQVAESQKFDVDAFQFPPNVPADVQESIRNDFKLSQKLQAMVLELAEKVHTGENTMSWEDLQKAVNELVLKERGTEYGLPLPSMYDIERPMVLASGVPLHHLPPAARTEFEEELSRKIRVRNSWSMLGDREICIVETEEGPMALPRYYAGNRMRKIIDGSILRAGTSQTAEAEMRAMESLKKRINERQWDSYVLSGLFPELSEKSGIHYFFRKGYPTLAVSYRPGIKKGFESGRVIACLCLHPMGYFQGSHCGLMCPTDEVICQLLMMRADEKKYWGKCGQWSVTDPRSGV
jgi:hypothetical protein